MPCIIRIPFDFGRQVLPFRFLTSSKKVLVLCALGVGALFFPFAFHPTVFHWNSRRACLPVTYRKASPPRTRLGSTIGRAAEFTVRLPINSYF